MVGILDKLRLRDDVIVTSATDPETRQTEYCLELPDTREVFEFGEEEYFLWCQVNEHGSFEDLARAFEARFGMDLTRANLDEFIASLEYMGLAEPADAPPRRAAQASGRGEGRRRAAQPEPDDFIGDFDMPSPRPAAMAPPPKRSARARDPFAIRLGDPTKLYGFLGFWLGFLRYLRFLLPVAVFFAVLVAFHRTVEMGEDFRAMVSAWTIIVEGLVGLFVVSLGCQIMQGVVAQRFGARIDSLYLTAKYGFIVIFVNAKRDISRLPRRGQLWSWGMPSLTRLMIFTLGIIVWAFYRETSEGIARAALLIAHIGLISFIIASLPFLPNDASRWVAVYFNSPHLRQRSLNLLHRWVRFQGTPDVVHGTERFVLTAYGLGIVCFFVAEATVIWIFAAVLLEERLQAFGIILILIQFAIFLVWIVMSRSIARKTQAAKDAREQVRAEIFSALTPDFGPTPYEPHDADDFVEPASTDPFRQQADPWPAFAAAAATAGARRQRTRTAEADDPWASIMAPRLASPGGLPARQGQGALLRRLAAMDLPAQMGHARYPVVEPLSPRIKWIRRGIGLALAGGLAWVAFLPYSYEPSGFFTVLPSHHFQVPAQMSQSVVEIRVKEGDWVEKGQVLAVQADWDAVHVVAVTQANLDKAKASLAELEERPTPEQLALAKAQVDQAQSTVAYLKGQAARNAQLLAQGVVAQATAEMHQTNYAKALADLSVAKANYDYVKAGATQAEIDAMRAEVNRLTQELKYQTDQLARTVIRAPSDGRVITPNVDLLLGKYLPAGTLFLELEDTRVVQADVQVPERDIGLIRSGSTVRLKPWGFEGREIQGKVLVVSPKADTSDYGYVVRVKTEVPNPDGILRTQMSGYAKVDSADMATWEAFLRTIIRFCEVEVWSWLP